MPKGKKSKPIAAVTFTVKTNANAFWLYCREGLSDPIRIDLKNGVGRQDFQVGSEQVAELTLHASWHKTADFTIEQEAASGNILLAERLGIVATNPDEYTVKVPFTVADPDCT